VPRVATISMTLAILADKNVNKKLWFVAWIMWMVNGIEDLQVRVRDISVSRAVYHSSTLD
jgi:hypothetical protein